MLWKDLKIEMNVKTLNNNKMDTHKTLPFLHEQDDLQAIKKTNCITDLNGKNVVNNSLQCTDKPSLVGNQRNEFYYQNAYDVYEKSFGFTSPIEPIFLHLIPFAYKALNDYIIVYTKNEYEIPFDQNMLTEIHSFITRYYTVEPTKENAIRLMQMFLTEKKTDFVASFQFYKKNDRIRDEKLWQVPQPLTKDDRQVIECELEQMPSGSYTTESARKLLSQENPFRQDYLFKIGVTSPRIRYQW